MRLATLTAILLFALSAVACGQEIERPASMSTPTTAAEVRLAGPLPARNTVIEEPEGANFFVLDVDSGDVYAIVNAVPGEAQSGARWLHNDSLIVKAEDGVYELSLHGGVSLIPSTPAPAPTPRGCICGIIDCSICDGPLVSADGGWTVSQEQGAYGQIIVSPVSEGVSFRLNSADAPAWAPVGHLLAFNGNVCVGFDIFLFDPVSRQLTNLTMPLQGAALDFLWRPEGSVIAVDAPLSGELRSLGLIDIQTGAYTDLVEVNGYGELRPLEWSPDGKRLLFFHFGGGGFCEGVGQPGVPTPAPTTLEILGE